MKKIGYDSMSSNNLKVDALIEPGGPFSSSHWSFQFCYKISCHGISLWYLAVDYFLSRFISTTSEQQKSEAFIYVVFTVC